jgi:DNA-binding response OmpR family regulator
VASVLIVDDELGFSTGMAEFLRHLGHSVTCVDTLAKARDALTARHPALLLLDLMLPDGSGLELLSEVKEAPPQRIVINTGHPGSRSIIQGLVGTGVTFLTKPVEPKEIAAILRSIETGSAAEWRLRRSATLWPPARRIATNAQGVHARPSGGCDGYGGADSGRERKPARNCSPKRSTWRAGARASTWW